MAKKRKPTTNNLIAVSDLHCGCRLGLAPDAPIQLDDGGTYRGSKLQDAVWGYWQEFWGTWVPLVTRNEPYDVVVNGDVIDGVHHNSTTQISHNIEDQIRLAETVLLPIVDNCRSGGGQFYMVRGTEAHVGPSGVHEEMIARRLGAVPNEAGQYARHELWKRVGGALVHCLHHVGTTSSAAHEASAVNAELTSEYVEAARWRHEPPDFVVRSHRHRFIAVELDTAKGYGAAVVTPGWQLRTPFTYRLAGVRVRNPSSAGFAYAAVTKSIF